MWPTCLPGAQNQGRKRERWGYLPGAAHSSAGPWVRGRCTQPGQRVSGGHSPPSVRASTDGSGAAGPLRCQAGLRPSSWPYPAWAVHWAWERPPRLVAQAWGARGLTSLRRDCGPGRKLRISPASCPALNVHHPRDLRGDGQQSLPRSRHEGRWGTREGQPRTAGGAPWPQGLARLPQPAPHPPSGSTAGRCGRQVWQVGVAGRWQAHQPQDQLHPSSSHNQDGDNCCV